MRKLKILSIFITVAFLSGTHMCAAGEAFAFFHHAAEIGSAHSHEAGCLGDSVERGHHHDADSGENDHEKTSCCSDLPAIQGNSNFVLQKPNLENFFASLQVFPSMRPAFTYLARGMSNPINFSPETSPSAVFLLIHFNHAPPLVS